MGGEAQAVIFLLLVVIAALVFVILYQRFSFGRGIQANLKQVSRKLEEISGSDSDEKVMVFTDSPALMELEGEINGLLLDRQKVKADFKRGELALKKMLANVSHDIKTPLTVILGYLEIMRLADSDNEMLLKVEAKAKQLMELTGQFFTLAKLEAGDADITIASIDVSEICRESALGFYEILLQKDFEVEISIPDGAVYAQGDQNALQRILYNLLSNAVRYGGDGKYIGIFLREDKGGVWIDITDKGKGIEKEFTDCIFERLYTMEDSRNREVQGNGLGLTIAKSLAVSMGGGISVDSVPGVQTTFTVRLKK